MAEPEDTFEKYEVQRIVKAAQAFMLDPRTDSRLRDQIDRWIRNLFGACLTADDQASNDMALVLLSVAENAFNLGAMCGTPSEVAAYKAGKHSAGGMKSAQARQKKARRWQVHAAELMRVIREERPAWSQGKVALETIARWKLAEVEAPGMKTLTNFLSQLEQDGILDQRS